jgi:hypothetical protein
MGRFEPTGPIEDRELEHSVITLAWNVQQGALGASDGTAGVMSNVPGALAVLRHAPLYAAFPAEIEEAFAVLEQHVMRENRVYPVALATLPFLFDFVRRGSVVAERITRVIAKYAARSTDPRLHEHIAGHCDEIMRWLGKHDRAACALAIHIAALRAPVRAAIAATRTLSPCMLLAFIELGAAPDRAIAIAKHTLDRGDVSANARMAAAAFLARFGERSPELCTRIDAALPPSAPAALARYVAELWQPSIDRPVVAPKLCEGTVVFVGEKLVRVRTSEHTVTLPWQQSWIQRGDPIQVGITVHGQPRLAVVTDPDGRVTVIDF